MLDGAETAPVRHAVSSIIPGGDQRALRRCGCGREPETVRRGGHLIFDRPHRFGLFGSIRRLPDNQAYFVPTVINPPINWNSWLVAQLSGPSEVIFGFVFHSAVRNRLDGRATRGGSALAPVGGTSVDSCGQEYERWIRTATRRDNNYCSSTSKPRGRAMIGCRREP